jgi:hypothetical protein
MREGTTSRVMVADRPYGEFYDFYSVSPEYFEYYLVRLKRIKNILPEFFNRFQTLTLMYHVFLQ